jgi:hypothetical protein
MEMAFWGPYGLVSLLIRVPGRLDKKPISRTALWAVVAREEEKTECGRIYSSKLPSPYGGKG